MAQLSVVIIAEAQVIPTPNALKNKSFFALNLSLSSLTIVSGTETEDVLPYL